MQLNIMYTFVSPPSYNMQNKWTFFFPDTLQTQMQTPINTIPLSARIRPNPQCTRIVYRGEMYPKINYFL